MRRMREASSKSTSGHKNRKGGKRRFYAVAAGFYPGIYKSDKEARRAYEGFPCAVHRMFKNPKLAVEWMRQHCHQPWEDRPWGRPYGPEPASANEMPLRPDRPKEHQEVQPNNPGEGVRAAKPS